MQVFVFIPPPPTVFGYITAYQVLIPKHDEISFPSTAQISLVLWPSYRCITSRMRSVPNATAVGIMSPGGVSLEQNCFCCLTKFHL